MEWILFPKLNSKNPIPERKLKMNEFENFLKSLDPDVIKKVTSFAASAEGEKLISRLSGGNKEELFKKVSSMSDKEKNALIDKIKGNPSLLSKIKGMI